MDELTLTAYHEAGHAVARHALGLSLRRVSIVPKAGVLGFVAGAGVPQSLLYADNWTPRNVVWVQNHIVAAFAGHAAEAWAANDPSINPDGWEADRDSIADLALRLCGSEEEVTALLTWLEIRARNLVSTSHNWRAVTALADELLRVRQLTGKEARTVIVHSFTQGRK